MRLFSSIFLFLFFCFGATAQEASYVYKNPQDSSHNCYLKIIPRSGEITGLIIRDYSHLPDISTPSPYHFTDLAVKDGFLVLYTCTSNFFPELCYTDTPLVLLDAIVNEVITAHNIPRQNVFIGGISSSGTRALQFAKFCEQGKSKFGTKIKAVFAVDSPLDFERFYYSAKNNGPKFTDGMAWEAELMMDVFPQRLGTPEKNAANYLDRSVYSQFQNDGGNATYFKNIPIIMFHEPDLDWWQAERNAAYFDINSFDINGFANRLQLLGNRDVTIITTSGKGYQNGMRQCHSWSIVDEPFLVQWLLAHIN